jgi:hypothetical protein
MPAVSRTVNCKRSAAARVHAIPDEVIAVLLMMRGGAWEGEAR